MPDGTGRKAYIDQNKCVGCGVCIQNCPAGAIVMMPGWRSQVNSAKCIGCGTCLKICHKKAVYFLYSH